MNTTHNTNEIFSSTISVLNSPSGSLYTDFSSDSTTQEDSKAKVKSEESVTNVASEAEQAQTTDEKKDKRPKWKDWVDTSNPLHCKPCDFTAKDMQEFQDHSLSYKHIKKTAEILEIKVNTKKDETKKPVTSFMCEVCMCTCNSESAWNSHLLGQKHRKNLEKQGAERNFMKQKMKYGGAVGSNTGPVYTTQHYHSNTPYHRQPPQEYHPLGGHCANDFAQYKEPLIGLEYVTEIQVAGQNPRYHCKLCDAKFDHNIKFPHLVGAKHRFNVLKEKDPSAAQEIRVGVKKRSELTEKLLEVARKIEKEEGRKQVKTCVEASPLEASPTSSIPPLLSPGLARGHPLKGSPHHPTKGSMKRNLPYQSFDGGSMSNYGQPRGRGLQQRGAMRGRDGFSENFRGRGSSGVDRGRGRGRGRGAASSYGRGGYNQHHYQNPGASNSYQQYQPPSQSIQFQPSPLLPSEAFHPRSPSRSQPSHSSEMPYSYTPPNNQNYGSSQTPPESWDHAPAERLPGPAVSEPSEPTDLQPSSTPKSPEASKQSLLQNLSDLGKLVNSEEDASIALQVSNALTQALLNYRMQNLE